MATEPFVRSSLHPTPGWLTVDEVATNLSVDRILVERLVSAGSLRHARDVVLGEVITRIPLSEVYRLEKLLDRHRHRVRDVPESSLESPPETGMPPRALLEERERKFAALGTLLTARIRELEGQLVAAQTRLAEACEELEVVQSEKLALVEERKHLVETIASHGQIRERLAELVHNTAHDAERRTLREELAVSRTRLAAAEERLAIAASLEKRLQQALAELDTTGKVIARQANEIEVLREVERNNQRYIDRLERRLSTEED